MLDVIFMFTVISVIGSFFGLFFAFLDWKEESHRLFFWEKWYLDWNKAEGERRLKRVKSRR